MVLTVRDATQNDAHTVAQLLGDMGYPTSAAAAAAHISRFVTDPASRLQVAEGSSQEGAVGLLATHIVPRLDSDGFTCRITDLVVSATHRRCGIGSILIAAAEQ